MPHNDLDPTANTDKFRAFVEDEEQNRNSKAGPGGVVMAVGAAVVALAAVAVVAWVFVVG